MSLSSNVVSIGSVSSCVNRSAPVLWQVQWRRRVYLSQLHELYCVKCLLNIGDFIIQACHAALKVHLHELVLSAIERLFSTQRSVEVSLPLRNKDRRSTSGLAYEMSSWKLLSVLSTSSRDVT